MNPHTLLAFFTIYLINCYLIKVLVKVPEILCKICYPQHNFSIIRYVHLHYRQSPSYTKIHEGNIQPETTVTEKGGGGGEVKRPPLPFAQVFCPYLPQCLSFPLCLVCHVKAGGPFHSFMVSTKSQSNISGKFV